eukprot:2781360-Pleurochrysis_carterae.AAC.1
MVPDLQRVCVEAMVPDLQRMCVEAMVAAFGAPAENYVRHGCVECLRARANTCVLGLRVRAQVVRATVGFDACERALSAAVSAARRLSKRTASLCSRAHASRRVSKRARTRSLAPARFARNLL